VSRKKPSDGGSVAVGLGDVNVDLKVAVKADEVECVLTFRGNKVVLVFADDGTVNEAKFPRGSKASAR
jgi:hypothetical protein